MTDHITDRIEFVAQTAAAVAVRDWIDNPPPPSPDEPWTRRALIGCTPAMIAQTAADAYRRSREASCAITTATQLEILPDGCVIRCATGAPWHKSGRYNPAEPWWCAGSEVESDAAGIVLPAHLIWHPSWARS